MHKYCKTSVAGWEERLYISHRVVFLFLVCCHADLEINFVTLPNYRTDQVWSKSVNKLKLYLTCKILLYDLKMGSSLPNQIISKACLNDIYMQDSWELKCCQYVHTIFDSNLWPWKWDPGHHHNTFLMPVLKMHLCKLEDYSNSVIG